MSVVQIGNGKRKASESGMKEYIVQAIEQEAIDSFDAHNAPELIRCKDCKHRPKEPDWKTYESGFDLEFPEGSKCPCRCCGDELYSWYPEDEWFCADGKKRDNNDG